MVYFADAQTFLHQSALLLEARPTTTRLCTRYKIRRPSTINRKPKPTLTSTVTVPIPAIDPSSTPATSRAELVLKTYDPVSGICLKYRTDKHWEVGRLVDGLSRCARTMAALVADELKVEAAEVKEGKAEVQPAEVAAPLGKEFKVGQGKTSGAGGGGKKKKGKR